MKSLIIALAFLFLPFSVHASDIRGASVFAQVNAQRAAQHQRALVPNAQLVKAAQLKADDMAKNGYFAHRSPQGKSLVTFINQVKYPYSIAGENLAQGYGSTESLVYAWMHSPTHKANILEASYTETGIAIAQGKNGLLVVQMFGRPINR